MEINVKQNDGRTTVRVIDPSQDDLICREQTLNQGEEITLTATNEDSADGIEVSEVKTVGGEPVEVQEGSPESERAPGANPDTDDTGERSAGVGGLGDQEEPEVGSNQPPSETQPQTTGEERGGEEKRGESEEQRS